MWILTNQTDFSAESIWTRDERGAEFWMVAIKACFEIDEDGRQRVAEVQTPVHYVPEFAGDPLCSGLVHEGDFALWKAGTDVLVTGHAHAPEGRAVERIGIRLKLADIDKRLIVLGERQIYEGAVGLGLTAPYPFVKMPVVWERTYGGWDRTGERETWDEANPAGCGFARAGTHLVGTQAPNIEYPDAPYGGAGSGRAAGLGALAHHWSARAKYAGTYDAAWEKTRNPLLPADFDRRYWRAAPEDQQTKAPLIGYEQVALGGMTPEGVWSLILPRLKFDVISRFKGGADVRQAPAIHTLKLCPDERRFEIVYQTALEVPPGREEKLAETVVRLNPRLGVPDAVRRAGVWTGQELARAG
ncbi:DUF2169 domain-containing protein [Aquicoccus sp. G2-2]|uniref:DUF2169 family type VI secretion system accessory protein n=1 Tax=Aquicoccus sp. G2-2 TaxID=3092120 RepID=UPI002AE06FD3|nr:DUF2169 domain-containing protein [Aquicoccus sp. G2-2]MEA1113404.1 DUF2169 domain-containing protein [Aquicoccus sp. G2-2]